MCVHVLLVEDSALVVDALRLLLEETGHRVSAAFNVRQAVDTARAEHPDVILLDLMVPGMTGIEILRDLTGPNAVPNFKSKIVITTNLDQDDSSRAEIEAHADGYLIKANITPKELVSYVNKLF